MNRRQHLAIGLAVLVAAVPAFLLVLQLDGPGLAEFGQQVRHQGNRWLLPVRVAVYAWTVWWFPELYGFRGPRLTQMRMTVVALAIFVELVVVQRFFIF